MKLEEIRRLYSSEPNIEPGSLSEDDVFEYLKSNGKKTANEIALYFNVSGQKVAIVCGRMIKSKKVSRVQVRSNYHKVYAYMIKKGVK